MRSIEWASNPRLKALWADVILEMTSGPDDDLIHALETYRLELERHGSRSPALCSLIMGLRNAHLSPRPRKQIPITVEDSPI